MLRRLERDSILRFANSQLAEQPPSGRSRTSWGGLGDRRLSQEHARSNAEPGTWNTHIGITEQARAVANLPAPKLPEPAASAAQVQEPALHGRCKNCSAAGHSVSPIGNYRSVQKRLNPCDSKGLVTDRRRLSPDGKLEAAGIEPASRNISVGASTRVDDQFIPSPNRPPIVRVPYRLARN